MEPDHPGQLPELLRHPRPPADLAARLKQNFAHQFAEEQRQQRRFTGYRAVAAGVLLVASVALHQLWWVPASFIRDAWTHTEHEAMLTGQFAAPAYGVWRAMVDLPEAPADASLVLIKDCSVQARTFKHLRFQYPDGNLVDVLVARHAPVPLRGQGGDSSQGYWLSARNDSLWLLTLYRSPAAADHARSLLRQWRATEI